LQDKADHSYALIYTEGKDVMNYYMSKEIPVSSLISNKHVSQKFSTTREEKELI
jgi:hypothetical protein